MSGLVTNSSQIDLLYQFQLPGYPWVKSTWGTMSHERKKTSRIHLFNGSFIQNLGDSLLKFYCVDVKENISLKTDDEEKYIQ